MDLIVLKSFVPELFFSFCILLQLINNSLVTTNSKYNYPLINKEILTQIFCILTCLFLLLFNTKIEGFFFNFLFLNDFSAINIKEIIIFICLLILPSVVRSFESQNLSFFEYFTLFLSSILASILLINAFDMLSAYLVLEMQALSFYVLSCFRRNSAFSTEAGLKYFLSGSYISGVFLLGCSIIFGLTGTLNFNYLNSFLSIAFSNDLKVYSQFLIIGIVLITVVFLFKISAAPFHFWSPDVYEGAPLSSTIIFSTIPKLSLFYFFFKWLCVVQFFFELKFLLITCGAFSIFFGSFLALYQKRIKRLIIFSSIAQVGFLVMSLSNTTFSSFVAMFFFLLVYLLTSVLVWSNISLLYSFQRKICVFKSEGYYPLFLSSFASLFDIHKTWSVVNLLIFFSLAGIPPLVGFFAKTLIILSLVESKNLLGCFLLLITSAISTFYYLRILKIIFFEKQKTLKISYSQVIFKNFFFEIECFIISFISFSLIYLFFNPSILIKFGCLASSFFYSKQLIF